jgi:hypothetical protein
VSAIAEPLLVGNTPPGGDTGPTTLGRVAHPVAPLLSPEIEASQPAEFVEEYYRLRAEAITLSESDPLSHGYEPPAWKEADGWLAEFRRKHPVGPIVFMLLGGNRASKTEWRSKRLVEAMLSRKNYLAWACHSTQASSRDAQQRKIYRYIPPEYRPESGRARQGKVLKVNYTPWGGFTDDNFALPSPEGGVSQCMFKYYGVDPRSLEGAEINEGWMDEESPVEWLDVLIGRGVTREAVIYLTFTAKHGYTPLVRAILDGAQTVEEVEGELLVSFENHSGKVPRKQFNETIVISSGGEDDDGTAASTLKTRGAIYYFHTSDNPFGNPQSMMQTLRGQPLERILWQFYGVPTRSKRAVFPLFGENHIVSLNRFREIQKNGGTWYQFLDPCSNRNWFQIWVLADPLGRFFVRAESPSHGHSEAYIPGVGMPEPWAVPGKSADGAKGGGQQEWGWGYRRYIEEMGRVEGLIASLESGEWGSDRLEACLPSQAGSLTSGDAATVKVWERWIDARYSNAKRTAEEHPTTLIEDLEDLGMRFLGAPSERSIDLDAHRGSTRMINDLLFYDVARPIDATNEPRLYVCESCPNVIYALKEWTGIDGQHGATKDPIDCLRMLVLSGVKYVDEMMFAPSVPWMGMRR